MTAAKKLVDDKYLKTLVPLRDLDADRFNKVTKHCVVEQYDTGNRIFQIGDRDNRTIYLLSGQVNLTFRSGTERTISANSNQAHHALVPEQPRQATAVAKTPLSVLVIDSDKLDQVLHWNGSYGYEVSEIAADDEDDNDWMTMFLQSKAFLKLRAQNIQALMMRLEEIPVKTNQVIVRQGDDDGYYYIVKRGRCRVSRKPTSQSKAVEIATLGVGAGFGEEAIIMHDRRGATVTMIEDGQLMRLSRNDFTRLLAEPLIQVVSYEDAVKNKKCVFLDVRPYEDYVKNGISNSENTPLAELRAKINTFDSHKRYVIVSNTGGRASAATFLLCQQGLDAVVLSRGMAGVPKGAPRGNGSVADLEKIPTIDNVVSLNVTPPQDTAPATNENTETQQRKAQRVDPKVNALLTDAKQRMGLEAKKAQAAETARKKAEQEVARLKAEAEQARLQAEQANRQVEAAAQETAEAARMEAIKEAARLREAELGCIQAEVEEAVKQAEEEAQRAQAAEGAYHLAQEEIAKLKEEMQQALARTQEEARKSTEEVRLLAEQETRRLRAAAQKQAEQEAKRIRELEQARHHAETQIERLKVEAELTRLRLEEQARISADAARTEAEQNAARLRAKELSKEQAEKDRALQKAEQETRRAAAAEEARKQAEREIERMRQEAENARVQAEQQAEQKRVKQLAEKQSEIDSAKQRAQQEEERARSAEQARLSSESAMQRLRDEAESARQQLENQLAAEVSRSEIEQQIARVRAAELEKKQAEINNIVKKAQQDTERAHRAEEARIEAEREIAKLKTEVDAAREQKRQPANVQEQADADAELVRKQNEIEQVRLRAEEEAARTQTAVQAHEQAQAEIARLKAEMQAVSEQAQAQLTEDSQRAEAERENMRLQSEVLKNKEREIEKAANSAQMEALRAQEAIDARIKAEQEVERLKAQSGMVEQAVQERLRVTERQATERAEREIAQARADEAARHQAQIQEAASQAREEANRAAIAEQARREAEQEIARLKQAAEQERIRAKKVIEASVKTARQNADTIRVKKLAAAKAQKVVRNQRAGDKPRQQAAPSDSAGRFSSLSEPAEHDLSWMQVSAPRQTDYFADESRQMNEDSLFADIDSDLDELGPIVPEMNDKRRQPGETPNLEMEEEDTGSWVSDQVMWETALGIRQDDKINHIIAPDFGDEPQGELTPEGNIDIAHQQQDGNRAVFRGRDINPHLIKQASIPYVKRRRRGGLLRKSVLAIVASGVIGAAGYYYSMDEKAQINLQLQIAEMITGKSTDGLSGVSNKPDIAKDAAALVEKTQARLKNKDKPVSKPGSKPVRKPKVSSVSKPAIRPSTKSTSATTQPRTFTGKDIPLATPPLPAESSAEVSTTASSHEASAPTVLGNSSALPDDSTVVQPPIPGERTVEEAVQLGTSDSVPSIEQATSIEYEKVSTDLGANLDGSSDNAESQLINERVTGLSGESGTVDNTSTEITSSGIEVTEVATPEVVDAPAQPPLPTDVAEQPVAPANVGKPEIENSAPTQTTVEQAQDVESVF